MSWQAWLILYFMIGIGIAELGGARYRRWPRFMYIFFLLFWLPTIILCHLFGEER